MNLEKDDFSLEMKDWCIHILVQYTKRPIASTRNKEHVPASFCKESDDIRLLNPASNENLLFAIFCSFWLSGSPTRFPFPRIVLSCRSVPAGFFSEDLNLLSSTQSEDALFYDRIFNGTIIP